MKELLSDTSDTSIYASLLLNKGLEKTVIKKKSATKYKCALKKMDFFKNI